MESDQATRDGMPSAAQFTPSLRVLVVDDNVDAAVALDLWLRSLGHETRVAHDGITALRLAAQFNPDVVLLDIFMPHLDGYAVARRLRALRMDHPLRIVAVTGWAEGTDRTQLREAGFDLQLVKPLDMNDLARALKVSSEAAH
ncbi:MAG TPA: response regulator [Burkholderiales bacterium]|nr:response regulator [Burkholderiales bacterium]